MKIQMHSSNCPATDAMIHAAKRSLNKCIKWIDESAVIDVSCRIEREDVHVEIVVNGIKHPTIASAMSHDYYESLELATRRLEKQLIKNRKRKISLKHSGSPNTSQNEKKIGKCEDTEDLILDDEEALMLLKKQEEGALLYVDPDQPLTRILLAE